MPDFSGSLSDSVLSITREAPHKRFLRSIDQVSFSGDYAVEKHRSVLIVTERAVFGLDASGLILEEIAPGIDLQRDLLDQMEFAPVIPRTPRLMDARIFADQVMEFSVKPRRNLVQKLFSALWELS